MTKRPRRQPRALPRELGQDAFPALRAFLRGYLHQDFVAVYGSLRAAADAFRADASAEERAALTQELESLVELTTALPVNALRQFFEGLGSGWVMKSRGEVVEMLDVIRAG
jgi:hypothetical protein